MEGRSKIRLFDARSVGFAIYLVLSSTSAWGLLSFASVSTMPFGGTGGIETVRSIGYIGILLLFGLGCLYLPSQFKRDTTYSSTVCLVLGYGGFSLWITLGIDSDFLAGLSTFLIGAGSSLSFIMWQRLFGEGDRELAIRQIIVGSALSALLYLIISSVAVFWVYVVLLLVCVVLNAYLLQRCKDHVFDETRTSLIVESYKDNTLSNIISSTWRYMLCIAAIGYVGGVSRLLAQQGGGNPLLLNSVLAIGMLIAALALFAVWEPLRDRFSFRVVSTALFFGVMTGFLFLPFFDVTYRLIFAGASNAAFSVVSIFMMITCLKIASLRQIDPIGVFGIFASIVYGGVLVGRAVGDVVGPSYDVSQILVIALMSIYLLSFAGIVVNSRKASKSDDAFDPMHAIPDTTADAQDGKSTPDATVEKSRKTPAPPDDPAPPPLVRNLIVAQDMVPFYCRMVKKAYSLSNRETDILELILRGRNVARMSETLFVSENTVRSHCKNLYRKLDVHSRQQVFDLVEEFRKKEEHDAPDETLS